MARGTTTLAPRGHDSQPDNLTKTTRPEAAPETSKTSAEVRKTKSGTLRGDGSRALEGRLVRPGTGSMGQDFPARKTIKIGCF